MHTLRVRLFGNLSLSSDQQEVAGLSASRPRELLSYLLLHRDRVHSRRVLAGLLWGENSTDQAQKNLRQTIWQLQSALENGHTAVGAQVLHVGPEDVELKSGDSLWLDVEVFEQAFGEAEGSRGRDLDPAQVAVLDEAARLYRGDLLEGWYQDWCLFERERLQNMYFAILDKLMGHCEAHARYDAGLAYGAQILRLDRARERAHRRMMRLYFLEGDRTAALRQYERCVEALEEELGVTPDQRTQQLYRHIRADLPATAPMPLQGDDVMRPLVEALGHLEQLKAGLASLQQQVELRIQTIEQLVHRTS